MQSITERRAQLVIDTLHSIHQLGILHNDIRIENIIVDDNGTPFLIDFGFATKSRSSYLQRQEREQLLKCLQKIN